MHLISRRFKIIITLLLLPMLTMAQVDLEKKVQNPDFSITRSYGFYPYKYNIGSYSLRHDPVIEWDAKHYVAIWRPDEVGKGKERMVQMIEAPYKTIWKKTFELEDYEEILDVAKSGSKVVIISSGYRKKAKQVSLTKREFDGKTGKLTTTDLQVKTGSSTNYFESNLSSSKNYLIAYNYYAENRKSKVSVNEDVMLTSNELIKRYYNFKTIEYTLYEIKDGELIKADDGVLNVECNGEWQHVGLYVNNIGSVFSIRYNVESYDMKIAKCEKGKLGDELTANNGSKIFGLKIFYGNYFPPLIGDNDIVYLPKLEYESNSLVLLEISAIELDFNKNSVEHNKHLKVDKKLLDQVMEGRTALGLKTYDALNKYVIRQLYLTKNNELIFALQKNSMDYDMMKGKLQTVASDFILVKFDDDNMASYTTFPAYQLVDEQIMYTCLGYFGRINENNELQIIIHDVMDNQGRSVNPKTQPFYIKVELDDMKVNEREALYDPKSKICYTFIDYSAWLGNDRICIWIRDGNFNDGNYNLLIKLPD